MEGQAHQGVPLRGGQPISRAALPGPGRAAPLRGGRQLAPTLPVDHHSAISRAIVSESTKLRPQAPVVLLVPYSCPNFSH